MYKAVIQGVPERAKSIKKMMDCLSFCEVGLFLDAERKGPLHSFMSIMEKYQHSDYLLYLQDDLMFPENIEELLKEQYEYAKSNKVDFLCLFAPNRRDIIEAYNRGERHTSYHPVWIQAVLISPEMQRMFLEKINEFDLENNPKGDDMYVNFLLKKYKIKQQVCLPSIVQHNMDIPSSLGHTKSSTRQSKVYIGDENNNKSSQGKVR